MFVYIYCTENTMLSRKCRACVRRAPTNSAARCCCSGAPPVARKRRAAEMRPRGEGAARRRRLGGRMMVDGPVMCAPFGTNKRNALCVHLHFAHALLRVCCAVRRLCVGFCVCATARKGIWYERRSYNIFIFLHAANVTLRVVNSLDRARSGRRDVCSDDFTHGMMAAVCPIISTGLMSPVSRVYGDA